MYTSLNPEQEEVAEEAVRWYKYSSEQIFQISGGPGTGKTFLINEILRRLNIPIEDTLPMAYIGAAAINMRMKGMYNAKTIHSSLFKPIEVIKTDHMGRPVMDNYLNRPITVSGFEEIDVSDKKLMIIDEGGSVPYKLKKSIESRGIKILVAGDLDQLPPVKDKPAYLYEGKVHFINQIMRQNEKSSIVYLSRRALADLPIHCGYYGDSIVIEEDELNDIMLANAQMIISGTNDTREYINNRIRRNILGIQLDLPCYMEKVVCRKNNWRIDVDGINLANGLIGNVINQPGVHAFDGETYQIDFKPIFMSSYFKGLECDYKYLMAPPNLRQSIKKDRFSRGEKMEFAYCITAHIAQGSQFNSGIYIEDFLNKNIQRNLNYVGLSRFANSVIYVKRKRHFYQGYKNNV